MKKSFKILLITAFALTAATLCLANCSSLARVKGESGEVLDLAIHKKEVLNLNGDRQSIYISGADGGNPVLLWLDGGPGGSEIGWVRHYLGELHRTFTIVCWDQRGTAGNYYAAKNPKGIEVGDYVKDVISISEYLKDEFGERPIFLAGHSWGSIIGVKAVSARPELYAAYIGIGQQVNGPDNDRTGWKMVRDGAAAAGEWKLVHKLNDNGEPPYEDGQKYYDFFKHLYRFSPRSPDQAVFDSLKMFTAPEHSFIDRINLVRGLINGIKHVYPQVAYLDLEKEISVLECPVFLISGKYDFTCIPAFARQWLERLDAPVKDLVVFEKSGHEPCYTEPARFIEYMNETVLPQSSYRLAEY